MRRFCPSLTDLQTFEAAARYSSFTQAAQALCVTQGAVSKQIKHLEEFVGVKLFLRIRQGLILTEAGQVYLQKIQTGLSEIEAATMELIAHQGQGGTLHLTCMPTFGARWLIPRLTAFMRQRPDIRIEFLPHRQGYDFSTPELDVAVRFGEGIWPERSRLRLVDMRDEDDLCSASCSKADRLRISPSLVADRHAEGHLSRSEHTSLAPGCVSRLFRRVELHLVLPACNRPVAIDHQRRDQRFVARATLGAKDDANTRPPRCVCDLVPGYRAPSRNTGSQGGTPLFGAR